ncbi:MULTISPECIES: hypothetical protein [Pseudomonas]|nr:MULTISPECIES: hypothetical protein [Pseudomonas]NWD99670.1 hypothetical protein [Pseudomonas sp. IPO3749]NWF21377.1 hypothetical protein [Pseudomonas sp. IPO3749]
MADRQTGHGSLASWCDSLKWGICVRPGMRPGHGEARMIGNRYVYDRGVEGLAWVTVQTDGVQIVKKDVSYGAHSISLHTIDDLGGADKLRDEATLLNYLSPLLSDQKHLTPADFKKVLLDAGEFLPRIWRGHRGNPFLDQYDVLNPQLVYGRSFMGSVVASESLFKEVSEVFRFVEPDQPNYGVFSHKLRELLILLCTEIEANWKPIYDLNYPSKQVTRHTTKDYFLLKAPLRLGSYKARLKDYPHCSFSPYVSWDGTAPTSSLTWYDAYNAVKHDRESNFHRSTLEHVLNACAALHILQVTQWGPSLFDVMDSPRYSIFEVTEFPNVPISEVYVPLIGTESDFSTSRPYETI